MERALLGKLTEILGEIAWASVSPRHERGSPDAPDVVLELETEAGPPAALHVHVKNEMRPSSFPSWAAQRACDTEGNAVPVLAMPIVSTRLAELCRQARWSWIDLSGNCWLKVPGRLHIERHGNPPTHRPPRPAGSLGSSAAARVMRVLLSPAHAERSWTQREIQESTCCQVPSDRPASLGLVNKVLRHLRDEGYIADADKRGVRLQDPTGLLQAWCQSYRFKRHERRSYFTLLKHVGLELALHETGLASGGMVAYATFSAAERQAPQVRQPRTWIYVAADALDMLEENTQAKEVDSGENLVVLIPDDSGVFLFPEAAPPVGDHSLDSTNPVQTYVDLMHCGGRGEEAAQAVLEQRILPAWRSAGLA